MHIIMVTNPVFPDKFGGLERYVGSLSSRLGALEIQVSVVAKATAPDQPLQSELAHNVTIYRYFAPSKRDPLFAAKYTRIVRKQVASMVSGLYGCGKQTLVHGHFGVPVSALINVPIPFVYTFHAPAYRELLSERRNSYVLPPVIEGAAVQGLKRLESNVLRSAGRVYSLSKFMLTEALELAPSVSEKWQLIPGGIDTERFHMASEHGGPVSRLEIFCARRLVERTGVDLLVEAMPDVLRVHPQAHLSIAGEGLLQNSLERQIQRLGLTANVELLGRISEDELVARYQKAAVCVTPTRALEGFGLSTAEALACGSPAVVTPVGANAEVVGDLDSRLVAADSSPHSIAEAINRVLRNPDFEGVFRKKASRFANDRYGWNSVVDAYCESYARML